MSAGKHARRKLLHQKSSSDWPSSIPPKNFILLDDAKRGSIETPLDKFGRVALVELVSVIKDSVKPHYEWDSSYDDVHHLQWPKRIYHEFDKKYGYDFYDPLATKYRNLPINQLRTPRIFHDYLHFITSPPPMPSESAMRETIKAQGDVARLASIVHTARAVDYDLTKSSQYRKDFLDFKLSEFRMALNEIIDSNPNMDFAHFDAEQLFNEVEDSHNMLSLAEPLGRFLVAQTIILSTVHKGDCLENHQMKPTTNYLYNRMRRKLAN